MVASLFTTSPGLAAEAARVISGVAVSPGFFNPSIGQRETITFTVAREGTVGVEVLDRDGFAVRTLGPQPVKPGSVSLSWDGKDDGGQVVPDEAYALRIAFSGEGVSETYDPSNHFRPAIQDVTSATYSRGEAIIAYTLPWPARVHIMAGQAQPDPATHEAKGPVLKTVVDSQPRVGGSVVEQWNGLDESGTIYVPDLPHFVIGIAIASLPANAIITVGNRGTSFFDYAQKHRPPAALKPRRRSSTPGKHHVGLTAFEEHSPHLLIDAKAAFDPVSRTYRVSRGPLAVTAALDPRRAQYFCTPSSELNVFVDETLVVKQPAAESPVRVTIGADSLPPGRHRLAFDWTSGAGPVAAGAMVVDVVESSLPGKPEKP